ncbi:MAG TPA: hemolysin III family protein [Actinomycetota bacterium]
MSAALAPAKPRLRGWIHEIAFFVSVPAGITLVLLAGSPLAKVVAGIYAVSLTAVFGSSAAYHRGRWSPAALRRMKRLDHSMIFVLIAGSYTPVSVFALHGTWSVVMLSLAWATAAVGITLKLAKIDGLQVTTAILYMGAGWLALVALPQIVHGLSVPAIVLMVAGGLLYTAGAIIFASKRPDPRPATFGYHEVWHSFMTAAVVCHWVMILLVVRAAG